MSVAFGVSLSPAWRRRPFGAPACTRLPIDADAGDLVVFRSAARELPAVVERPWNDPLVP